MLDGEGGYTVWGKLLPAATSLALGGLPLGLAHNVKLVRAVRQGEVLRWYDVAIDERLPAYRTRREMEALFAPRVAEESASPRIDPLRGDKLSEESISGR